MDNNNNNNNNIKKDMTVIIPSELSMDDILDGLNSVVEEENVPSSEANNNSIINFISFYELKHGTDLVKVNALYGVYKNWSAVDVGFSNFNKTMGTIFQRSEHTFICIDLQNNIKMSDSIKELLIEKAREDVYSKVINTHIINKIIDNLKETGVVSDVHGKWIQLPVVYSLYYRHCVLNKIKKSNFYNFKELVSLIYDNKTLKETNNLIWLKVNEALFKEKVTDEILEEATKYIERKEYKEKIKRKYGKQNKNKQESSV